MFRRSKTNNPGNVLASAPQILLASEGRAVSPGAIAKAVELASASNGAVHVLTVARIWGSPLGLPHPGLQPSARELQLQRDHVAAAIEALKQSRIDATGEVLRSRNAARAIANRAKEKLCAAIVMTADAKPNWLQRSLMWPHQPYCVEGLAKLPVHLVIDDAAKP